MTVEISDLTPKARRTRSRLLEAVRSELGHQGVAGVTVMGVCEKAGIGRTSFYNYFEDTGALVSVVATETAVEIKERFDKLHLGLPRGRDRLRACLEMIMGMAVEEPESVLLVTSLSNSFPEIMDILETEITAELEAFTSSSGEDLEVLTQFLAATVLSLARQMATGHLSRRDIKQHVEFMMRACS